MSRSEYEKRIVETFRVNALRTAHIIDDSFPTYRELAANDDAKTRFKEWELAVELYDLFRAQHIPCDVENTVDSIRGDVERIRKSDLIVLDYNLAPGDTRMSVALVRALARTRHFNTVVVYTAERDLKQVWLNFAAALRGGWSSSDDEEGSPDRELAGLFDEGLVVDRPSTSMIADFVTGDPLETRNAPELALLRGALAEAGVAAERQRSLLEALIRREVRDLLKDDKDSRAAELESVDGRCADGRPLWLQSGNCFVAVLGKPVDGERAVAADTLFDALDAALCDWRPNLLQILVSEIQNILETEAVATDELHLRDPHTQVSLCYFLLLALSGADGDRPRAVLDAPISSILDKLVEGVRQRLLGEPQLQTLGGDLLLEELARLKIPSYADRTAKEKGLYEHAQTMAGAKVAQDRHQALLKLNAFLSTEPFRGRLTTGTVFTDGETHWVCMTPACDMVDRPPTADQDWLHRLHPLKPVVAARLKPRDARAALKEAENSRNLFIKAPDGMLVFDVLLKTGGPVYEFLYLDGAAPARDGEVYTFEGLRVWKEEGGPTPTQLTRTAFRVVGQVRSDYASRVLQQTGAWLSRIGVDFVRAAG